MTELQKTPSGIPPLDRQIGGIIPHRPYVISGNPGTGKSVSCLEFLDVAIQHGESAALLTHDDPTDVLASAEFLGMDFDEALSAGRLVILRFHLDFARRYGRAASADEVFLELRRHLRDSNPTRLAIDSVVPFLDGGGSSSAPIFALTRHLEEMGVTSLITYPGDIGGLYDRRLEPLMQRAGGLFHLSAVPGGRRRGLLEIRKLRFEAPSVAPLQFRIEPGAGYMQDGEPNASDETLRAERLSHILLLNLETPFPDGILKALEHDYRVTARSGVASAFSDLARAGVGGVLLNVRRDVINDALQLLRELRQADVRVPVMVVTPYLLRSSDRTRALRAGADEFASLNTPPEELLERVRSMVQRGRSANIGPSRADRAGPSQPTDASGAWRAMDAEAFAMSLQAYLAVSRAPYFTLVRLRPADGSVAAVAALLLRTARVDSGDLVGIVNDEALLLADGARPKDLESLLGRLMQQWQQDNSADLTYELLAYPGDEDRVHQLLGLAE